MTSSARSALLDTLHLIPSPGAASSAASPSTKIPAFLYGCAWKKDRTDGLVYNAVNAGFQGIDVAAQPRHYREDLAGAGLRRAFAEGKVKRGDLFVQTKFSPISAHDPANVPYDANASIAEQVRESVAGSLRNLRQDEDKDSVSAAYIDSLVLHSPYRAIDDTLEAWTAMASFVPHSVRFLGISNTTLPVLRALYSESSVKPAVVQNRFCRDTGYDVGVRKFCRDNGIIYQSFWTLSANPHLLKSSPVVTLAKAADVSPAVALYALVMSLENIIVLNGTSSHMEEDLQGLQSVKTWAQSQSNYEWENLVKHFKDLTGDNGQ